MCIRDRLFTVGESGNHNMPYPKRNVHALCRVEEFLRPLDRLRCDFAVLFRVIVLDVVEYQVGVLKDIVIFAHSASRGVKTGVYPVFAAKPET